jgi:hypothetical protein
MFCLESLWAQHTFQGRVVDSNTQPLSDALLTLSVDSILLGSAFTDFNGEFVLHADVRTAQLRIEAVGFSTQELSLQASDSVQIVMSPLLTQMDEVTVINKMPLLERKVDRTVFNIGQSMQAAGSNALNLIAKMAGVIVNVQNNTIELVGKSSVEIMIDDRPVLFSGEDLFNYLSTLSSDNIERIEVITMPPARYNAAGNSGIIALVMKKQKGLGWNGTLRGSYEQASMALFSSGLQLNYKQKALSIFGNINASRSSNIITEQLTTSFDDYQFETTDYYIKRQKPVQASLGMSYDLSNHTTHGLEWNHSQYHRNDASHADIAVATINMPADSGIRTLGNSRLDNQTNILNFYLSHHLDTIGHTITAQVNKLWYNSNRTTDFSTIYFQDLFHVPIPTLTFNRSQGNQEIQILTMQVDASLPVRSKIAYSTGAKLAAINNASDNVFGGFYQGAFEPISHLSNAFTYSERIAAAYVSAQRSWGKWAVQLGLRGEYTFTKGESHSLQQVNTNRYFNVFPSVYLQYNYSGSSVFNLSYGKRINRPGYRALDPFRAYATLYHYNQGNPFLLPSLNHNVEMSYMVGNRFTLSAFYQFEKNHSGTLWQVDKVNNITANVFANFAHIHNYGCSVFGNIRMTANWDVQTMISLQVQSLRSTLYTPNIATYTLPTMYLSFNNQITLNAARNLMVEVNGYFSSRTRYDFIEVGAIGSLNAGIKYLAFNRALAISLNGSDLLATQRSNGNHLVTGQKIKSYFDTRSVRLSISYIFGNSELKLRKLEKKSIDEEKARGIQ